MKKTVMSVLEEWSLPLIMGIIIALFWANYNTISYQNFLHYKILGQVDIHFLVNDVFLVLFFGLITCEIVHDFSEGGNLHPFHKVLNNVLAAIGGVLCPILLFFGLNHYLGQQSYESGWAIPTATDIAVALLFAKFVFFRGHPAFTFLLLLAVIDDFIGLGIIALFYPDPINPIKPIFLLLVLFAVVLSFMLKKIKVKSYWFYVLPAFISWVGMFYAGLHPSLALVWIVPLMKTQAPKHSAPMDKFEKDLRPIVTLGLFFFGLCNAGVAFSNVSLLTFFVYISLLLGKISGILFFVWLGTKIGFSQNKLLGIHEMILIGLLASIGLTVSLFVADIAYLDTDLKDASKMGALLSVANGFIAILYSRIIKHEKGKWTSYIQDVSLRILGKEQRY